MRYPAVSVVANSHEGLRIDMLERGLRSILAQTYRDFEVVHVHDGAPSQEVLDVAAKFDALFDEAGIDYRFMALDEQAGSQSLPKNTATYASTGDFLAYLDLDNESLPHRLQISVEAMEQGEEWPDIAYGRRTYCIDPSYIPEEHGGTEFASGPSEYVPWGEGALKRLATSPANNFIDTSDFMIARAALYRLAVATEKMWDESITRFGDWNLLYRGALMSAFGKGSPYAVPWRFKSIDSVVSKYWIHGANKSLETTVVPQEDSLL